MTSYSKFLKTIFLLYVSTNCLWLNETKITIRHFWHEFRISELNKVQTDNSVSITLYDSVQLCKLIYGTDRWSEVHKGQEVLPSRADAIHLVNRWQNAAANPNSRDKQRPENPA